MLLNRWFLVEFLTIRFIIEFFNKPLSAGTNRHYKSKEHKN